jgi:hypothetical protein
MSLSVRRLQDYVEEEQARKAGSKIRFRMTLDRISRYTLVKFG